MSMLVPIGEIASLMSVRYPPRARLTGLTRLGRRGGAGAGRQPPLPSTTVRHAGPTALDRLEPLLDELRLVPGLTEKSRGVFYRRSRAFLHFHEDPSGLYADVRTGADFERFALTSRDERRKLVALVRSL